VITLISSWKLTAILGYVGLVASLFLAIFVNKWIAIILGAVPLAGVLASTLSIALAQRVANRSRPRHTIAPHRPLP
jgi:hypothetical protein